MVGDQMRSQAEDRRLSQFPHLLRLARSVLAKVPYAKPVIKETIRIIKRDPKIASGEFDLAELPDLIGKDNPVILDVGSNDGGHTLEFLRLFKEPKIYSFEPDPRALERFKSKVTDTRVKLLEVAISDTDGTTKFYMSNGLPSPDWAELLPKGWDASGSIRMPKRHLDEAPWCRFDESIIVETKRLDTWFREEGIGMIDFIWADVQGAEIDLIRGGRCALNHARYFYTEYSDDELYQGQIGLKELLKLLPDFALIQRFSHDVLLKNRFIR